MADEPDRLSELPDDLLQHILHLAPCREAESTAVLSRRWRGLWPPPTGAVKIHIPSRDIRFRSHDASLQAVEEALAASRGPVERLAIDLGLDYNSFVHVVGVVLSHPASQGVQDVRITAESSSNRDVSLGEFTFSFGSVPSAALRALHLTNCSDITQDMVPTFPCLEVLRLRRCLVTLQRLQDVVAASPQLASLQLEQVKILCSTLRYNNVWADNWGAADNWAVDWGSLDLAQSICCPGVTTLVLLDCSFESVASIELDVPRVQHFRYRGKMNQFTLRSPLPDVRRVYLHIVQDGYHSADEACGSFWTFLKNFSGTKVLKLKNDWLIDYVADLERRRNKDLLIGENQSAQSIMFCVEHLEIDALYNPESKHAGVGIGYLLQCCPALRDLRLKLNTAPPLQREAQLEFHKSIDHFRRRRDRSVVPLCRDDGKFEVSDIPGLSDRWMHFSCLRFHLRRMSLQFDMDKYNPNCIGIQLVKFFIERGMALEEMCIHDGNMKMWEHMNCMISRYAANPQPISEYKVLARMSQDLSMEQFSSSKISGCFNPHKLDVRRTNPWFGSRSFTILPLADKYMNGKF